MFQSRRQTRACRAKRSANSKRAGGTSPWWKISRIWLRNCQLCCLFLPCCCLSLPLCSPQSLPTDSVKLRSNFDADFAIHLRRPGVAGILLVHRARESEWVLQIAGDARWRRRRWRSATLGSDAHQRHQRLALLSRLYRRLSQDQVGLATNISFRILGNKDTASYHISRFTLWYQRPRDSRRSSKHRQLRVYMGSGGRFCSLPASAAAARPKSNGVTQAAPHLFLWCHVFTTGWVLVEVIHSLFMRLNCMCHIDICSVIAIMSWLFNIHLMGNSLRKRSCRRPLWTQQMDRLLYLRRQSSRSATLHLSHQRCLLIRSHRLRSPLQSSPLHRPSRTSRRNCPASKWWLANGSKRGVISVVLVHFKGFFVNL